MCFASNIFGGEMSRKGGCLNVIRCLTRVLCCFYVNHCLVAFANSIFYVFCALVFVLFRKIVFWSPNPALFKLFYSTRCYLVRSLLAILFSFNYILMMCQLHSHNFSLFFPPSSYLRRLFFPHGVSILRTAVCTIFSACHLLSYETSFIYEYQLASYQTRRGKVTRLRWNLPTMLETCETQFRAVGNSGWLNT